MCWTDLDLEAKTWTLPARVTKAGRGHIVPLVPRAIEILDELPRKSVRGLDGKLRLSPWVFTISGDAPISGFSKAKPRLDEIIADARKKEKLEALAPWVIHDLRRTAATEMGRLGISRFIIGKILNHADRTVTAIYDRYAYLDEKRHALETWAQYLGSLTQPPGKNVVTLKRA
jgi:integrase